MDRTEFLARRRLGIGGSDVAGILGISKWKTPRKIWEDKTGRTPLEDRQTPSQYWGTILEEIVADEFVRRTGLKVQKRNSPFLHKDHPELLANIDRYIVGGAVLECKTSSTSLGWGPDGSDEVPEYYLTQVQHYMHVTGYPMAYLAALISEHGHEFRIYQIQYNRDLAEYQAEECLKFWRDYVLTDTPPPATVHDDLDSVFPGRLGEIKVADAPALELIAQYATYCARVKEDGDRKKELGDRIRLFCENADTITDGSGRVILTNRRAKDSVSTATDWEGIARELCPAEWITDALIAKHQTTTTRQGARRLLLKNSKGA